MVARGQYRRMIMLMKNQVHPLVNLLHSSLNGPVPFDAALLKSCLPMERPVESSERDSEITYQAYMSALKQFVFRRRDLFRQIIVEKGFDVSRVGLDLRRWTFP